MDISVRNLVIMGSVNAMRRLLSGVGVKRRRLRPFVEGKRSVLISVKKSYRVGIHVVSNVIRSRVNRRISIIPAENYVKN